MNLPSRRQPRVQFWGLVAAAGILATLPTVATLGARHWWVLDLTSHFRLQYLIGLSVLALLLGMGRRWGALAVVSAALLLNTAVVLPLYASAKPVAVAGEPTVRLLLSNVLTGNDQFAKVRDLIRAADPDLVALQEVDLRWETALAELADRYPHRVAQPRGDNFGIMLLSKLPLEDRQVLDLADIGVPSIWVRFRLAGQPVRLLTSHPIPPSSAAGTACRNRQLAAVAATLRAEAGPRILIGDLNTSPWSPVFRQVCAAAGLRDSAQGWGIQPTWPTMSVWFRVPIDHCLVSPELIVRDRVVGPDVGSDHFPLLVTLALRRE